MADDHDDQHDDVLAAALAVEPLDEVTRRRLVARALDASTAAPRAAASTSAVRSRTRLAAIAAAIAFLVLGVLAIALPGNDSSEVAGRSNRQKAAVPSTARAPAAPATSVPPTPAVAASPGGTAEGDQAAAATSSGPSTGLAIHDLGDLGDLSARGSRARVLDAATRQPESAEPFSATTATGSCASEQVDTLVATGTGKLDGRDAVVLVTRRADGSLRARAVLTDTCDVRRLP